MAIAGLLIWYAPLRRNYAGPPKPNSIRWPLELVALLAFVSFGERANRIAIRGQSIRGREAVASLGYC